MGNYVNWVKKAEAPDIENYYAFSTDKQKKAVRNLFYCLSMFCLHVISGLLNSQSSHSFLVYFPYIFVFLPFPFLLYASVWLFILPESISKKQWDKSLGSLKHADTGLIVTTSVCTVCEIVFFFTHISILKGTSDFQTELAFFILQVILLAAGILYGIFFDKNFSGS